MKSTQYSKRVLDHFRNPRNVGVIENPDGYGKVGNPVCGDIMEMFINVGKNDAGEEVITDIKFKTFGCGSAVATSSMTTEMAKGKKLDEAYKITRGDVAEELEGLPPIKMHCSNLAAGALKAAIDNYRTGEDQTAQAETFCKTIDFDIIKGIDEFMGKGVYKEAKNLEQFGGKRVLVIDNGNKSIELAVELTKHTGRVVLVTSSATPPGSEDLQKELKRSDVKTLYQSEILKILGTDSIEKVKIHDMDEDENYELYVDVLILLEQD